MVPLALLLAVFVIDCADARPPLPALPKKDGCFWVSEFKLFRLEGEAVILSFPGFLRTLHLRHIAPPASHYRITRGNGTGGVAYEGKGRVQQQDRQLWLLPAQASDSGEYTCTYRNETYCITSSIMLQVYESSSVDMEKLSYPYHTSVGEKLPLRCPSLGEFNQTEQIEWYKDPGPAAARLSSTASSRGCRVDPWIPGVQRSHQGARYTCQLTVSINNQQYRVSRTLRLQVSVPVPDPRFLTSSPATDLSMTSDPSLLSTADTPIIQPPVIVSPLNGSIFESAHGSGLELFCKVLTGCHSADSTLVTWLVNGQSVESSYLDGRALQGGRRVTRVEGGCQVESRLVVIAMTEEDTKTELKCVTQNQGGRQEVVAQLRLEDSMFTWLTVAVVSLSCVLTVLSVFLYVLLKPKTKTDYFLARQNSTF
ncbi:interleukin-1 receptor type 2 [Centroberyx affinis]|uniref:interleukin-1 receptor type 2 n=1 Tax=Centroberyx affinis TaxID=166261 RepID=UPI003A5BEF3E